jgi:Fe-S-cluster containining protein
MKVKREKINYFKCIRCGTYCRYKSVVLLDFKIDDWTKIIPFIKEKYNGTLTVKCGCGCGEINSFEIHSIETIKNAFKTKNALYIALDSGECPFLKKERDEKGRFTGKYFCEIYDIRPELCRIYPYNH